MRVSRGYPWARNRDFITIVVLRLANPHAMALTRVAASDTTVLAMPTRTFFQFGKIIFGSPQVFALMLLACLALQSGWLIMHVPFSFSEQDHIWSGREELEYGSMPRKFLYSPLVNIWASAPMKLDERRIIRKDPTAEHVRREVARLRSMLRLPFVLAGLLL